MKHRGSCPDFFYEGNTVFTYLQLGCLLTVPEVPSIKAKRNTIPAICTVFIWALVLYALRSPLGLLVMNGSGLPQESMTFLNLTVFLFSCIERLALLYLPLLAAHRKIQVSGCGTCGFG